MLDLADIADVVAGAVREATAPLIARLEVVESRELVLPEKGDRGEKGEPGIVDPDVLKALVDEAVAGIELPEPIPGEPGVPGEPGDTGPAGKDGEPGEKGADGKDGVGLADALIDNEGRLVLTLTDGRTKALGVVKGQDGANGRDGADGRTFSLDDFDIIPYDDERTFKMCFTQGDVMHSFEISFPVVLDRGVWQERAYEKGDAVTWGGSLWIAQKDTDAKPDTADSGWRLAVKRGRDGRDAK